MKKCNFCSGCEFDVVYVFSSSKIVECTQCHLIFTLDDISSEDLASFYAQNYYVSTSDQLYFVNHFKKRLRPLYKYYCDKLEKYIPGKKLRLLEIGAGMGYFLEYAEVRGWEAHGIEPDIQFAMYAREVLHQDVVTGTLETVSGSGPYDVVCMFHTLEHVYDVKRVFEKIEALLVEGGICMVEVPNMGNPFARIQKQYYGGYEPYLHRYYFTSITLSSFFADHNFEVVDVQEKQSERNLFLITLLFTLCGMVGILPYVKPQVAKNYVLLEQNVSMLGGNFFRKKIATYVYRLLSIVEWFVYPIKWWVSKSHKGEELLVIGRKK